MVNGVTSQPALRTLVLIHGLGATPGVWDGVVDALDWQGQIVLPALPGHADAAWTGEYSVPALAESVASAVTAAVSSAGAVSSGDGPSAERVLVAGHSLGGAVGIELASGRYGLTVDGVLGLGIKTTWTEEDVAGMASVAGRGVRWYPTRDEAVARFLRLAGLDGVVDPKHPATVGAVVAGLGEDLDRGWRVAQDPATFAQEPVDMPALLGAARCRVWLGAGEHDEMATEQELAAFTDSPHVAAGRGHNVQVEDPSWVAGLVDALAAVTVGAS